MTGTDDDETRILRSKPTSDTHVGPPTELSAFSNGEDNVKQRHGAIAAGLLTVIALLLGACPNTLDSIDNPADSSEEDNGSGNEADDTSLVDHFDADFGISSDNSGSVTGWINKAGGNDVTVGDPETSVVEGPNGQSMVRFDNADGGVGLQYTVSGGLSKGYTAIVVARLNTAVNTISNAYLRMLRTVDDAQVLFIRQSSDQIEVKADPLTRSDRPVHDYSPTYSTGDILILVARLTETGQELYFNGVLVDSSSIPISSYTISDTVDSWEIGNSMRMADIGSVLVYDHTLTIDGLNNVGMALAQEYGTTWSRI